MPPLVAPSRLPVGSSANRMVGRGATARAIADYAEVPPGTSLLWLDTARVAAAVGAVPRVATLDVVAEPLLAGGVSRADAQGQAAVLLRRLNIPERLWALPPATFSGGEQQRVNIARGFISDLPVLLLDEPTASLDAVNRAVVVDLIAAKKQKGVAIVAIVHDDEMRELIADRLVDVTSFAAAA